jgi:hypothetical protein
VVWKVIFRNRGSFSGTCDTTSNSKLEVVSVAPSFEKVLGWSLFVVSIGFV